MSERIDFSSKLKTKDDIDAYIHPKKRSRIKMILDIHKVLFSDKGNIFRYLTYGICGGLMPVLSAYVIYWLISVIEKVDIGVNLSLSDGKYIIISAGIFCLIYLILSVIVVQIGLREKAYLMKYRMSTVNKALYKRSTIDLALFLDSRVQDSIGEYFNSLQSGDKGFEGILHKVFESTIPLVSFIIFSFILGRISIWIVLIGVISIIIAFLGQYKYSMYRESLQNDFTKLDRNLNKLSFLSQDFNYGKDMRIFSMQNIFYHLQNKALNKFKKLLSNVRKKKAIYTLPQALAFGIIDIGIIFIVIRKYFSGNINISNFAMILSISSIYVFQIISLSKAIGYLFEESVYLSYLFDYFDAELTSTGGKDMELKDFDNFNIVFDKVYFKYPGSSKYVLEDLSFKIKQGESLALVGVNGAGKTTITNLLTGLYLPTKGNIYIGGIDIKNLSKETLNKIIAMVFQDYQPLAMKVKENVSCQDEIEGDIDEEKVIDSLKRANIYEKISSFEKGIESNMLRVIDDDGLVLSGGENQKLSIARMLYKENTGLIIFDEPTSALDALAEEKLYKDFEKLTEGKSALFISHRLASTRFCDRIILLNGGKIEEFGTHEDLLESDGLYKEMYMTQASYYKEKSENE